MFQEVLVVSFTNEMLHKTDLKNAMRLIGQDKVEVIQFVDGKYIHTSNDIHLYPSVIRLKKPIAYTKRPISYTRRRIFTRDLDTCQYCGVKGVKLTIDHVHPQSKGGKSSWDNCVAACLTCNKDKSDMTYDEWVKKTNRRLRKMPKQPNFHHYVRCASVRNANKGIPEEWKQYCYMS